MKKKSLLVVSIIIMVSSFFFTVNTNAFTLLAKTCYANIGKNEMCNNSRSGSNIAWSWSSTANHHIYAANSSSATIKQIDLTGNATWRASGTPNKGPYYKNAWVEASGVTHVWIAGLKDARYFKDYGTMRRSFNATDNKGHVYSNIYFMDNEAASCYGGNCTEYYQNTYIKVNK